MKKHLWLLAFAFLCLGAGAAQTSDGTTIAQTPFVQPVVGPFHMTIGCTDASAKLTENESASNKSGTSACATGDHVIVTATSDKDGKPLPEFSIPRFDHDALIRIAICNVSKDNDGAPIEIHWDRTGGKANDNPGPGGAKTLEPGYCWGPSTVEEYRDIMVRVKEPGKSATVEWAFYP